MFKTVSMRMQPTCRSLHTYIVETLEDFQIRDKTDWFRLNATEAMCSGRQDLREGLTSQRLRLLTVRLLHRLASSGRVLHGGVDRRPVHSRCAAWARRRADCPLLLQAGSPNTLPPCSLSFASFSASSSSSLAALATHQLDGAVVVVVKPGVM
jgi:hypothetical protein